MNSAAVDMTPRKSEPTRGSVKVEISLKPADLFASVDGTVAQVAATNSFLLVQSTRGGEAHFHLFNEAYRPVQLPDGLLKALAPASIYGTELVEILQSNGKNALRVDQSTGGAALEFAELVRQLGLSAPEGERLRQALVSSCTNGEVSLEKLATLASVRLCSRDIRLSSDNDERYFIVESGRGVTVVRTINGDLRPLKPTEWEVATIPDCQNIAPEQMARFSVLEQLQSSSKGRLLAGMKFAVSHQNGVLTVVDTVQGKRILSEEAGAFTIDPTNENKILFVDSANQLRELDVLKVKGRTVSLAGKELPADGRVVMLKVDPHGNFLAVVAERAEGRTLYLLERDTLRIAGTVEEFGATFDFNRYGELYYADAKGRVRLANTNLDRFAPDGLIEARVVEKARLGTLLENTRGIQLPEVPGNALSARPEQPVQRSAVRERVIEEARDQVNSQLLRVIDAAPAGDELEKVARQIQLLKEDERFREYPEVFSQVDEKLAERLDGIEVARLEEMLSTFREKIRREIGTEDLPAIHDAWNSIKRTRMNLTLSQEEVRKRVDREFEELRGIAEVKIQDLEETVQAYLKTKFPTIQKLVQGTTYERDLGALRATQEFIEFEGAIQSIGATEARQEWRKRFQGLFKIQEETIARDEAKQEAEKMTRLAEAIEDLAQLQESIEKDVQTVSHSTEFIRWRKRNPLVLRYRGIVMSLPPEIRVKHESALDGILERRKRELQQVEQTNILRSGDQVTFGKEGFAIAPEIRLIHRPVVKPIPHSVDRGRLVFRDTSGREFVPEWRDVPLDLDAAEVQRAIEATKQDAEAYFEGLKPRVSKFDPLWTLNEWSKGVLDQIARACRDQLELGSGVVILEGEAGCGKDVFWRMFSHFTQRGLELIPCNAQAEKQDILYDFDYTPEKGTVRIPSKFLETVQIPNSMALFGEINTLPTGVAKMLNSAFDGSRIVAMAHGSPVEIEPSVLMCGTMNPQHYLATQKLSQEFLSRATVIHVDYPPFQGKDGTYTPYEAEIYAKHIPALKDATQEEFYKMWNYLVNKDRASDGDKFLTPERKLLIAHLAKMVDLANKVRTVYSAYHAGDMEAPKSAFVFTFREGIQVAKRLKPDSKVNEVLKEIVLPKISDPDEKARIEAMIDAAA